MNIGRESRTSQPFSSMFAEHHQETPKQLGSGRHVLTWSPPYLWGPAGERRNTERWETDWWKCVSLCRRYSNFWGDVPLLDNFGWLMLMTIWALDDSRQLNTWKRLSQELFNSQPWYSLSANGVYSVKRCFVKCLLPCGDWNIPNIYGAQCSMAKTVRLWMSKLHTAPWFQLYFCDFCCVFVRGNFSAPLGGQFQFEYHEHEGNLWLM